MYVSHFASLLTVHQSLPSSLGTLRSNILASSGNYRSLYILNPTTVVGLQWRL
jgi:hypothetical protein